MIGKLGLIGDVHGEAELLERALEALRSNGVSVIACTGDVVDGLQDLERKNSSQIALTREAASRRLFCLVRSPP